MRYILVLLLSGCSTLVPVSPKFPDVPTELTTPCHELAMINPTTKLSDVLDNVTSNYAEFHVCSAKVDAWNNWYKLQKETNSKVKK